MPITSFRQPPLYLVFSIVLLLIDALVYLFFSSSFLAELWEQDLTNEITIGPSTEGYKNVDLKCSAESMSIQIEMEDDFTGVLYIKGNYLNKKFPCFVDVNSGTKFKMKIPFDQCNVENVSICINI